MAPKLVYSSSTSSSSSSVVELEIERKKSIPMITITSAANNQVDGDVKNDKITTRNDTNRDRFIIDYVDKYSRAEGMTHGESPKQESPLKKVVNQNASLGAVFGVVAFYIVSSITMVLLNKAILKQTGLPLIFLWGQLVVAVLILFLSHLVGLLALPPVTWQIFWSLLPLTSINVLGLALNTLCLHNIDAMLYQVARSLILPITVIISMVALGQKVSLRVGVACGIISAGFLVGLFGEGGTRRIAISSVQGAGLSSATLGMVFGVLSSITTALHSVIIKHAFSSLPHNGAFDLVYYNNLFSALMLAPLLLLERIPFRSFIATNGTDGVRVLLLGTGLAGLSGLLINLAGFLQIKVTSPVTHTVSSASRGVLQTLAAWMLLGEVITTSRSIGIGVTLFGSCLYSYLKAFEPSKVTSAADARPHEYQKISQK